jgi:hypothetical protein
MSGRISSLLGAIAVVATLVSGVRAGVPNTAQADNCLTAPNASAPQGSRWYYHLNGKTQRKCWYTRAPSQPAQHATAHATSEAPPAAQSHSVSVPFGSSPTTPGLAADPKTCAGGQHDNGQSCPAKRARRSYRTVDSGNVCCAIKHVAADANMDGLALAPAAASPGTLPVVSTITDKVVPRSGHEGVTAPSILETSAPQSSTSPQTGALAPAAASPVPAVSMTTDKVVQRSGHEGITAPSILETSAAQSGTSPQPGAHMDGLALAPAAASPGTLPVVSTITDKVVPRSGHAGITGPSILETSAAQSGTSPQPGAHMDGLALAPAAASPGTLPAVSMTTDKVVQQSGHEEISAPSILETSAAQSGTSPEPGALAPAAASPGTLPAVSMTTDKVVQQSGHEEISAPSILETSAAQSSTSPQTGANMDGPALAPAAASPGTLPALSTITDKVVQQGGHEGITAPSILETSAAQSSTSPQTGANMDGLALAPVAASPATLPAGITVKAPQRIAVPTDEPEDTVRSNAHALARDGEPTTNPGKAGFLRLTPKMFLSLALGLAVLGTLSRIVIKIAAARARERQEQHSPISSTRDYGPRQLSRAADGRQDNARYKINEDDKYARLIQELVVSICRS